MKSLMKVLPCFGHHLFGYIDKMVDPVGPGNPKPNRTPVSERMCQLCRRVFSNRSMLRRHMVVHSSIPKFTCEMCGKGFKYRWNYTAHVREKCPKLHEAARAMALVDNNPPQVSKNGSQQGIESTDLDSDIPGLDIDMKKEIV